MRNETRLASSLPGWGGREGVKLFPRQACRRYDRRLPDAGSIPAASTFTLQHESDISATKPSQNNALAQPVRRAATHPPDTSEHSHDTFLHEKCVICVSNFPDDLALVVEAWDRLLEVMKVEILAMVKAVGQA